MNELPIDNLTYEELVELNRRVVDRLKFLDQIRTHTQMLEFRVGEQVCFTGSDGDTISGTLVKHNRKTVTVIAGEGARWNISPSLLSKPAAKRAEVPASGRIIDIGDGKSA